jgi:hypothetical protein
MGAADIVDVKLDPAEVYARRQRLSGESILITAPSASSHPLESPSQNGSGGAMGRT